jgi:hypothetical protein
MSDAPQAECPVCGGAGARQFFPIGIHFKGSGFYKTDSRSASPGTATAATGDGQNTPATTTKEPGPKKATDSAPASTPTPTTPPKSPPATAASTAD